MIDSIELQYFKFGYSKVFIDVFLSFGDKSNHSEQHSFTGRRVVFSITHDDLIEDDISIAIYNENSQLVVGKIRVQLGPHWINL